MLSLFCPKMGVRLSFTPFWLELQLGILNPDRLRSFAEVDVNDRANH
jgi:hypothetical protein